MLRTAETAGVEQRIVSTVVEVNARRKEGLADRVTRALGGSVEGRRIAILGLTFKPNTDDMRDAPSIPLVRGLLDRGATIVAFDPVGREQAERALPPIEYAAAAEDVADGADALVIVTEWDEFRALDLSEIAERMRGNVLVDLRNIYSQDEAEEAGLSYQGVGRGSGR